MTRFIIQSVFILVSLTIAYYTAAGIRFEQVKEVLSTLQNISAAVFTLAGIWIAYIYPEAIAAFTNPKKVSLIKGSEKTKRIEKLVLIILTSAFVLVTILLFNLSYMLLKNASVVIEYKEALKILSVGLIIFVSLNQIKAILAVMVNNIEFVNELHKNKTEQEANDEL